MTTVWGGSRIRSSADNAVLIITIVVTSVDSVGLIPGLCVQCAVSTKWDAVLGQNVAGEEVARLVVAVGVNEVILVEVSLRLASGGAQSRVEWTIVEEAHAVVGIVVLAVLLDQRSVDGSWEIGRSIEVRNSGCRLACG